MNVFIDEIKRTRSSALTLKWNIQFNKDNSGHCSERLCVCLSITNKLDKQYTSFVQYLIQAYSYVITLGKIVFAKQYTLQFNQHDHALSEALR